MNSVSKYLVIALAVLALSACSRTSLLYDNADWLAYRWAVDLLDARGGQRDDWRDQFRQLHIVHREQLLPDVVALLGMIEKQASDGLRQDALDCLVDELDSVYRHHAQLVVPLAAGLLSDISPTQIDHMAAELEERNREYAENYLNDDLTARLQDRFVRYLERIERWTGELSTAQAATVEVAIKAMPNTAEPWLQYRYQQQRRLLDLLANQPKQSELERFLSAWWIEFADRPAALVQRTDQVRRDSIRLILALDASLTQEQRENFVRRVSSLRKDLEGVTDYSRQAAIDRQLVQVCG